MNVKNKIRAGTLFLFLLLLITGGAGIYYIIQLKADSTAILSANDQSIEYCHSIQKAVDSLAFDPPAALQRIGAVLLLQERNVTEPGENAATRRVRAAFARMSAGDLSAGNLRSMDAALQEILGINLQAIQAKNRKAQATAEKALTIITTLGGVIFLIAFTFAYNFPGILTGPIRQFMIATQELGQRNYSHRIRLDTRDEFGQLARSFNNLAERLDLFEHSNLNQIMFEKARAEAVINSLKDASLGVDRNGTILFANNQALGLLGLKSADLVGKTVEMLKKRNDLFRFLLEDTVDDAPIKISVGEKENYFMRESLLVGEGAGQSRVIVLKNVTPFTEKDVAKTHFIATISHELKTPIASVKMGVKLLEKPATGMLNAEQTQLVAGIREDSDRLLRIVAELLNMAQVETGNLQMSLAAIAAEDILAFSLETVKSAQEHKKIDILVEKPANMPKIRADLDKSAWVLNNLLSNAIRHSPVSGRITVKLELRPPFLEISVKDEGKGISAEYLGKVFDRYFQVPGSNAGGTGLGLSISKQFIEAQGGRIQVESERGQGSRFWFTIPLAG